MRVLYISHACVLGVNQQRLVEMAALPDMELCLVAPTSWHEQTIGKRYTLNTNYSDCYQVVPGRITPILRGGLGYVFLTGLSRAVRAFRPDIIHVEAETTALVLTQAAFLGRRYGARVVAMCWESIYKKYPFPVSAVERFNLSAMDCAIAGNEEIAQVLRRKGFTKPIEIIPLGIDPSLFRPMDVSDLKTKLKLQGFVIGYMGRLVREKGLEILLRAVTQLRNEYTLLLDGSGDFKPRLVELASELNILEHIVFVDPVHVEVPLYMNCMDALVLPSITTPGWKEQFGRVLIEAMACEVPVIASDSGELPNTVGDAGLIFNEGDVNDLMAKLNSIINDRSLRQKLIQSGLNRAKKYGWEVIAHKTYKLYRSVTNGLDGNRGLLSGKSRF